MSEPANNLISLGAGNGSSSEQIKADSDYLHGQLAEELRNEDTSSLSAAQAQLLKFHGSYQQDDRDERAALRKTGEKAFQFMVRTRIPGGNLTAAQYLALDTLCETYGDANLRVTTRQGIQLHGILKGDLQVTIRSINVALLTTLAACGDVNRNVVACPAPLASRDAAQVQRFAEQIAQHLAPRTSAYYDLWLDGEKVTTDEPTPVGAIPCGCPPSDVEPIYGPTYLPRKFKIGIAYPGDNCIDVYTQDIGLVPEMAGDNLTGFTVLVGGGMGRTHGKTETYPHLAVPLAFVTPEQALPVIETIVMVQRDYGDRTNRKHARMKYLIAERGAAWLREETERRLGYPLADPLPLDWHDADDHLGWHRQADGNWFLGLFIENGRVIDLDGGAQVRSALRAVISRYGCDVRLTAQQNILLTGIAPSQKGIITMLLKRHGIVVKPTELGVRRLAMACPALPTCGLAVAEAERALPALLERIDAELRAVGLADEPISIRMTGCPNGCARPYMGDIGIVGRSKDLYAIFLGGDQENTRLNTIYAETVAFDDIPTVLRPLFALWQRERQPSEHFGDFVSRRGMENLRALAAAQEKRSPVVPVVVVEERAVGAR